MTSDRLLMPKRLLLAALLGTTLVSTALGGAALARTLSVMGTFEPETGVSTTPTGDVSGSFNTATHKLHYTATYSGMSGPLVAAHFHGPAKPGVNAGILKPIAKPYDSPIERTTTLTAAETRDLMHGLVYVNLHTAAHPDGEARAQLHVGHGK